MLVGTDLSSKIKTVSRVESLVNVIDGKYWMGGHHGPQR